MQRWGGRFGVWKETTRKESVESLKKLNWISERTVLNVRYSKFQNLEDRDLQNAKHSSDIQILNPIFNSFSFKTYFQMLVLIFWYVMVI